MQQALKKALIFFQSTAKTNVDLVKMLMPAVGNNHAILKKAHALDK